MHRVRAGSLRFNGRDITELASHRFCEAGIAIVPEGRRLFTQMTVLDNLELGSFIASAKAHRKASLEHVLSLFPVLKVKLDSPRSEEHTSELPSLMRISYAVFCLNKNT